MRSRGRRGQTTLRKVRTFREVDGHRFMRWAQQLGASRLVFVIGARKL